MLGYATLFTTLPVFSLVLDQVLIFCQSSQNRFFKVIKSTSILLKDVSGKKALELPELYRDLLRGRSLSFKTFFLWVIISIYQGTKQICLTYTRLKYQISYFF